MQFAIFGSGVATNQNLALILESAEAPTASGLGVALFALASTVSRVVVGILSDAYAHAFSRFQWLVAVSACAILAMSLVATMAVGPVMVGVFCAGLAFGVFFTVIVPVVNEMYGRRQFGVIMGAQLASQALASVCISIELLPAVYREAAHGMRVCLGPDCYRASFIALAVLNLLGLGAALLLERRNRDSMPLTRDA